MQWLLMKSCPGPIRLTRLANLAQYQGSVFDRLTEQPISGASVQLNIPADTRGRTIAVVATTNSKGWFSIRDIPPGTYVPRFSAHGYETRTFNEVLIAGKVNSVG